MTMQQGSVPLSGDELISLVTDLFGSVESAGQELSPGLYSVHNSPPLSPSPVLSSSAVSTSGRCQRVANGEASQRLALGNSYSFEAPRGDGVYVVSYKGARLGKMQVRSAAVARCVAGGVRGRVVSFSRKSRLRLLQRISAVDANAVDPKRWLFVHLTYPGEFSRDPKQWKRDLDVFWKRLERAWGDGWAAVWKLEPQTRMAPHYHLLLLPPKGYILHGPSIRAWVSRCWYEVVGSADERHLRAATRVDRVVSYKMAINYAAKYCGKTVTGEWMFADTGEVVSPGRFWGVLGRESIPITRVCWVLPDVKAGYTLRRWFARLWTTAGKSRIKRGEVFRSFSGFADYHTWEAFVEALGGRQLRGWEERMMDFRGRVAIGKFVEIKSVFDSKRRVLWDGPSLEHLDRKDRVTV